MAVTNPSPQIKVAVDDVIKGARSLLNFVGTGSVGITVAPDGAALDCTFVGYSTEVSCTKAGILPSNTGAQNTALYQSLVTATTGAAICFDTAGTYLFDRQAGNNPYNAVHGYVTDYGTGTRNLVITAVPGVTLKLADNQQIDRAGAGTGPIDFWVGKDITNLFLTGPFTLDGNTANQPGWVNSGNRYLQVDAGCLVYMYSVGTGGGTSNRNIVIQDVIFNGCFSNPVSIAACVGSYWKNLSAYNCGEGFLIVSGYGVFAENITYTDNLGVTVGDGFEYSNSVFCYVSNLTVNGHVLWVNGTGVDMAYSSHVVMDGVHCHTVPGGIDVGFTSTLYTDLVVDASNNKRVRSAGRPFGIGDLHGVVDVPVGTANGTVGRFIIVQLIGSDAILDHSPGATGTTDISFSTDVNYQVSGSDIHMQYVRNGILLLGDGETTWSNLTFADGQTASAYAVQVASGVTRGNHRVSNLKSRKNGTATIQGTCYLHLVNCSFTDALSGPGLTVQYAANRNPRVFVHGGDYSRNTVPISVDGQGNAWTPRCFFAIASAEGNNSSDQVTAVNSGSLALSTVLQHQYRITGGANLASEAGDATTVSSASYFFQDDAVGYWMYISSTSPWAGPDWFAITACASNKATLHKSVGGTGLSSGTWGMYSRPPIAENAGIFIATNNRDGIVFKTASGLDIRGGMRLDTGNILVIGGGHLTPTRIAGTLTVTGQSTFNNQLNLADTIHIALGTASGSQITTAANQKLAFHGVAPVIQHATTGQLVGFTAGSGSAAKDDSTYTGGSGTKAYTIGDIVLALKNKGILAAS